MKPLKIAAAMLAIALPMMAQKAPVKSSIMIIPYTWKSAYWGGYGYGYRDLSEPAFNRTVKAIADLPNFTAIDASAQELVKQALYDASGGAALNSDVQLDMGKKLAAKYILRGSVETVETNQAFQDQKSSYGTRIDINLQVIDVETGAVALTDKVTATNGLLPLPAPCTGNIVQKAACAPGWNMQARMVNSANAHARALMPMNSMDSQPHAVMAAIDNLNDAVQNFIKKGVTAGTIK